MAIKYSDRMVLGGQSSEYQVNAGLTLRSKNQHFVINYSGSVTPEEWATVYGPSPLLLPKAKANSLQYVKAFGGTEQSGTPTPDAPVDIVSNNGVLKYGVIGKNLFDPTKVLFGYYRDRTTGDKMQSSQNFMSSDDGYIPCLPNTTYTFVGTNKTDGTYSKYNTIYFFDSAKNYLGASPYEISQPTTGTTPNNCYYLQVRSNPLDASSVSIQDAFAQFNWQLEQGSTTTAYEPYKEGIYTDGTVETIWMHSKNLFDKNAVSIVAPSTSRSDFIRVVPGVEYSMSTRGASVIIEYNSEQTELQTLYIGASTYTPTAGTAFARFNVMNTYLDTFQIERGSTATDYVPYYNGGTATEEMLLKVGNYQDVQSIIDGEVTRSVGVKVLDGTEEFSSSILTNCWTLLQALGRGNFTDRTVYCTHFNHSATLLPASDRQGYAFIGYSGVDYTVGFGVTTQFPTQTQFKQWLANQYAAGTPVIVIYPLATPTTESVTGQTLQVQKGNNTLEITQASLNGLELEAKYKKTK